MISTYIHYRYTLVYTKDITIVTIQYKTYDGASKNDLPVFCSI